MHNKQLTVAPCGMILRQDTMFGVEGIASVAVSPPSFVSVWHTLITCCPQGIYQAHILCWSPQAWSYLLWQQLFTCSTCQVGSLFHQNWSLHWCLSLQMQTQGDPYILPRNCNPTAFLEFVMVMEAPTSFSLFSPTDCTLYSHFSFDNFVMIAFPDLTRDLDNPI